MTKFPTPKVIDNDKDEITARLGDVEIRGWSYSSDAERRAKMLAAHEFAEGWYQALSRPAGSGVPEGVARLRGAARLGKLWALRGLNAGINPDEAERHLAEIEAVLASPLSGDGGDAAELCSDCPAGDYPTDATRCAPCPRRAAPVPSPAQPVARALDKIKLWFFRDLTGDQRLSLFKLFGMPVDEIKSHGVEVHCFKHVFPASVSQSDGLVRALEEVAFAAGFMPRETPAPGGTSTVHQFAIDAGTVWALDRALRALEAHRASTEGGRG